MASGPVSEYSSPRWLGQTSGQRRMCRPETDGRRRPPHTSLMGLVPLFLQRRSHSPCHPGKAKPDLQRFGWTRRSAGLRKRPSSGCARLIVAQVASLQLLVLPSKSCRSPHFTTGRRTTPGRRSDKLTQIPYRGRRCSSRITPHIERKSIAPIVVAKANLSLHGLDLRRQASSRRPANYPAPDAQSPPVTASCCLGQVRSGLVASWGRGAAPQDR